MMPLMTPPTAADHAPVDDADDDTGLCRLLMMLVMPTADDAGYANRYR
jgi:hypothetical protein